MVAKAPRRWSVRAVAKGDRSSQSTQGAIGEAVLGGDRCVTQLTGHGSGLGAIVAAFEFCCNRCIVSLA